MNEKTNFEMISNAWPGVDGLGRVLPTYEDLPKKNDGKTRQVGLFYWTWHYPGIKNEPVNISELMKRHPDLHKNNYEDPRWWTLGDWDGTGKAPYPAGPYQHYWDEPLFGYYSSLDEWVLRRHAEMLADAGVDVVIFDNTNGTMTWPLAYRKVFEVFEKARKDGVNTPKISFLLPFGPGENTNSQLLQLYSDIYENGKYRDLWYYWDGKPLLMAHPDLLPVSGDGESARIGREILAFFCFRPGQPLYFSDPPVSNANPGGDIRWDWLSLYPQRIARKNGAPEQMAVGTAQNWTFGITGENNPRGGLTAFNGDNTLGRTFRYEDGDTSRPGYDTRENAVCYGANFGQQFDYALEADPEFIFITGWNEWTMGRYDYWPPHSPDPRTIYTINNAMPDQFNDEFSRDIEPSKGPLKDHYYYQMVSYIRKYKGADPLPEASGKLPAMDINGEAGQWDGVAPLYRPYENNVAPRDFEGHGKNHYKNCTGRNDIIEAKVAHDHGNIYFMAKTKNPLTPHTDPDWMRLLIGAGKTADDNWEGYRYILNRISPTDKKAILEKSNGGWDWSAVGQVSYNIGANGDMLAVEIPKSMLGISGDDFTIDFKWSDNTLAAGDIMDFYQYGDTAPGGRFNYRYKSKKQ